MNTRFCPKCTKERPVEDFKRRSRWCIGCVRTFVVRKMVRKEAAIEYLGGICMSPDCPIPKDYQLKPVCFDFHHRNPNDKYFNLNTMKNKPWDVVLAELDKCDLLCCLCHRLTHSKATITARCREFGIDYKTYRSRRDNGMTLEQIFTTPKQPGKKIVPDNLIEIGGVSKTAVDWCVELGANYRTYRTRVSRGWDKIEALTESPSRPTTLTINGQIKTIDQWCEHFGIARNNYRKRVASGMSPEAAVSTPKRPGAQSKPLQYCPGSKSNLTIKGETRTVYEWCLLFGLKFKTFKTRIDRGWDPVKAMTTPGGRKRNRKAEADYVLRKAASASRSTDGS